MGMGMGYNKCPKCWDRHDPTEPCTQPYQMIEPMKIDHDAITRYWAQFYCTSGETHCTLCGNSGIIDTRGIKTPAGVSAGRLNWCICPNGQTLRRAYNGEPTDRILSHFRS